MINEKKKYNKFPEKKSFTIIIEIVIFVSNNFASSALHQKWIKYLFNIHSSCMCVWFFLNPFFLFHFIFLIIIINFTFFTCKSLRIPDDKSHFSLKHIPRLSFNRSYIFRLILRFQNCVSLVWFELRVNTHHIHNLYFIYIYFVTVAQCSIFKSDQIRKFNLLLTRARSAPRVCEHVYVCLFFHLFTFYQFYINVVRVWFGI